MARKQPTFRPWTQAERDELEAVYLSRKYKFYDLVRIFRRAPKDIKTMIQILGLSAKAAAPASVKKPSGGATVTQCPPRYAHGGESQPNVRPKSKTYQL